MNDTGNKLVDEKDAAEELPSRKVLLTRKTLIVAGLILTNVLILALVILAMISGRTDKSEAAAPVAQVVDPLKTTARADSLLLAGRTKEALELYKIAAKTTSPHMTAITYRIALCLEVAGDLAEAAKYYEIVNSQDLTESSVAAQLGASRVYYKLKDYDATSNVLSPLASVSALPVLAQTNLGAEVGFMRALARSAQSQSVLPTSIMDPAYLFSESIELSVPDVLQFVPLEGSQLGMPMPVGDDTRMGVKILGQANEPDTTLASCGIHTQPASLLIDLIARETGWKMAVSQTASEILSAKRIEIQLQDKTVAELLSLVLEPQGLFWVYDEDTLIIDQIGNFPSEQILFRRRKHASALLLQVLSEAPRHPLAPHVYLALGNLAAINQRFEHAATFYRDVRERFPKHPISQRSGLNLAKILLRQSNRERAEKILYHVVDSRSDPALAPLAFLLLGDLHLSAENVTKAKQDFSRSLALATQAEVRAAAAMTLASVYLMQRSESTSSTANAVLMEHREVLRDPRWAEPVVFLSALTRYRVAIGPAEIRRRARELISAAVKVDPSSFFGGYGYLLVGDAFSELNLVVEATRTYEAGLISDAPESIRQLLLYRLATEHQNQHEFDLAIETLSKLSADKSSGLAGIASVDLAELLLRLDRIQNCIQHCRDSLAEDYADKFKMQLLGTLGRAYSALGRYEEASLCFGGFLPSPTTILAAELK